MRHEQDQANEPALPAKRQQLPWYMKTPLPQLAFVFLLLLPLLSRAQETRITGRVVDAKTRQPVPFASIGLRNSGAGTLANENGDFQLVVTESIKHDSMIVMTLGYERYAAIIESESSQNLTIELIRRHYEKARFERAETKSIVICNLRSTESQPNLIVPCPGAQYAFFIANEKNKKLGKLRTVWFYLGENGFPMEAFRIRLYKADGSYYSPKTDLLTERVFPVTSKAKESGEWYGYDLSHYNVAVPQEGFFVALEFGKPTDAVTQSSISNYIPSGYIMRPSDFIRSAFKPIKSTKYPS